MTLDSKQDTRSIVRRADVKGILKAELKRRGLTYADLAERLSANGVDETEPNLRNKISRGSFTAAFFVQCLVAIGCDHIRLGSTDQRSGGPFGPA